MIAVVTVDPHLLTVPPISCLMMQSAVTQRTDGGNCRHLTNDITQGVGYCSAIIYAEGNLPR